MKYLIYACDTNQFLMDKTSLSLIIEGEFNENMLCSIKGQSEIFLNRNEIYEIHT